MRALIDAIRSSDSHPIPYNIRADFERDKRRRLLLSILRRTEREVMSSPHGVTRHSHGRGSGGNSASSAGSSLHHPRGGSSSMGMTSRQALHPPTLQSDTVVFQHAKLPSRQVSSAASTASPRYARNGSRGSASGSTPLSNASASYSNAWSTSSAPGADAQRSTGYRDYREEHDDRMPSNGGSREFLSSRENPRHHHYDSTPRGGGGDRLGPTLNRRVSPSDSAPSRARDANRHGSDDTGSDSYMDDESVDDQEATSFTHLLQDAVALTSPSSRASVRHDQQQQQQQQILHDSESAHRNSVNTTSSAIPNPKQPGSSSVVRMTIRVMKEGNKLGFGIRHDSHRKLRVSTLQGNSAAAKSPLRLGDILLSVNGINLNDLGFLEVIQHLKATRPGELVFDIERDVDASPNHSYEFADLDAGGDEYLGDPSFGSTPAGGRMATNSKTSGAPPSRQVSPHAAAVASSRSAAETSSVVVATTSTCEPQKKRARPSPGAPAFEGDASKMEKTHKQVVNTLVLELKKEKAEKVHLEEKNNALRKRLQKMLIECDEVRVKASTEVTGVREKAKREVQELEKALVAARAHLRLQDRGPNVGRTDSVVNDLVACKAQLDRMKRIEADRGAQLSARYNMENRHADREAHRVREKLISLFQSQLRQVGKRGMGGNPAPMAASGGGGRSKMDGSPTVAVLYEGLRRLAFLKLFGLPHDYDHYTSPEFLSVSQMHRALERDEFGDLFGNALSHEERTGFFIVAIPPMDVVYDPSTERLNLVCGWVEQNTIRELARNFRF